MATELGQAYVQIMPSAKGIQGSISKQLAPEATSAGINAGGLLGSAMSTAIMGAVAVGVAGLGKLISSSISDGADLQQSMGGVETLFKNSADTVKKYANEAYKTTKPVIRYERKTGKTKLYEAKILAKNDGFDVTSISKCCHKKLKTHKGYEWYFEKDFDKDIV